MKRTLFLGFSLLAALALAGCDKENTNKEEPTQGAVDENDAFFENYDIINDFETIEDVILNKYDGFFGKVALNTDKKFVTRHAKSLLMMPKGDPIEINEKPKVKFSVGKDVRDIRKYSHLCFDIYNDSDIEVPFVLRLNFGSERGRTLATMDYDYKLEPKAWNNIYHRLNTETLALIYNVEDLKNIEFVFDFYEDSPKLYLDTLSFRKSSEEYHEIEIELDENEICSFEKDYQEYSFMSMGYGASEGITPIISMNTNPEYSKEGKSLRVLCPKSPNNGSSWPGIQLSPKIFPKIDFKNHLNDKFVMEAFNNSEKLFTLYLEFHETSDIQYVVGFDLLPMQWNKFEFTIKDLNKNSDPDKPITNNLSYLAIMYAEFSDREDVELFIDSIRIEK